MVSIPSVSVSYARNGSSTKANAFGMRPMQERAYEARRAIPPHQASPPADLRAAHERNDEVLERIYLGRRFRNDTERLEKLFALYTKMTADKTSGRSAPRKGKVLQARAP